MDNFSKVVALVVAVYWVFSSDDGMARHLRTGVNDAATIAISMIEEAGIYDFDGSVELLDGDRAVRQKTLPQAGAEIGATVQKMIPEPEWLRLCREDFNTFSPTDGTVRGGRKSGKRVPCPYKPFEDRWVQ